MNCQCTKGKSILVNQVGLCAPLHTNLRLFGACSVGEATLPPDAPDSPRRHSLSKLLLGVEPDLLLERLDHSIGAGAKELDIDS